MENIMYAMTTISNCYSTRDTKQTFWWSSQDAYDLTETQWKKIIKRSAENKAANLYREYFTPSVRFFKSKESFIKAYTKETGNKPNIE